MSTQHARSQLADQCLAEFREEALRIMQHTCAELSAVPEDRARPSLRARAGWRLVDLGLRLASEPGRHAPRPSRPAETQYEECGLGQAAQASDLRAQEDQPGRHKAPAA